ncbi:sigma-54-dependent Fis family transcriptional regulator [Enterovibrio makurazakiensis]|uniref:sigma-54-dependent Fis family transcriptional regulator n=1 Tax=Enterovibrio makurazakiensis TaxID=2910232 RepID=UPI003D1F5D3E
MSSYPQQNKEISQHVPTIISPISSSWQRCKQLYKLDPSHIPSVERLSKPEIKEDKERFDEMLVDSIPLLNNLRHTALDSGYCILVTNAQGVVIDRYIDSDVSRELSTECLQHGSVWSESLVGTNGVGTCLETQKSLTVFAEEHFGHPLKHLTCSAAPLIAPDGSIFGVLDVSSFARGNKEVQGFALNLVCETANKIEALLFRKQYDQHYLVALSSSAISNDLDTTCYVAINSSGIILAATTPSLTMMGVRKREEVIGQSFEHLFGISLDSVSSARGASIPASSTHHQAPLWVARVVSPAVERLFSAKRAPSRLKPTDANSPIMNIAGPDQTLIQQAAICLRTVNRSINILLQGETGTGKEVWAQAIHESSDRKNKPFVTLNCASIPESLIESELFGYSSGTFTGGLKGGKMGKILASDGGTIFLDEIGDMPLALQARLLRVIAENEITPLGQIEPIKVNLHVICATHRNLKELVKNGEFREDLYYRISGVNIKLPALRNRMDQSDIIDRILKKLCDDEGIESPYTVSKRALARLESYRWPGNIRQLKNVLQFAICMCDGKEIDLGDLPEEVMSSAPSSNENTTAPNNHVLSVDPALSADESLEKEHIMKILEENRWIVTRAAKAMNVSRSTLHRKLKKYDLLLAEDE